jgi:hypothetical protein
MLPTRYGICFSSSADRRTKRHRHVLQDHRMGLRLAVTWVNQHLLENGARFTVETCFSEYASGLSWRARRRPRLAQNNTTGRGRKFGTASSVVDAGQRATPLRANSVQIGGLCG